MIDHVVFRYGLGSVLKDQLEFRKSKNDKYSLRALARDINVSPSTLSKIINEKYTISDKMLEAIVDCLDLEHDVKVRVVFFEKCRKLGEFLGIPKARVGMQSALQFMEYRISVRLDETLFPEFTYYLKELNEGFVSAVEAISTNKATPIQLHYALNVVKGN